MNTKVLFLVAAISGGVAMPAAHAALVPVAAGFGAIDETFEGFDGLVTTGPQAIGGGASWSSDIDSTLGAFAVDLNANGTWGAGNKFAGIGDLFLGGSSYVGSVTLSFNAPVYGAGALFSIYQETGGTTAFTLEALGAGNVVLESHSVVINLNDPFANNAGLFYGIGRDAADIVGLRIGGDGFVLDDLRVATSPVPVPAALPLLASGLGLVGAVARRRRA